MRHVFQKDLPLSGGVRLCWAASVLCLLLSLRLAGLLVRLLWAFNGLCIRRRSKALHLGDPQLEAAVRGLFGAQRVDLELRDRLLEPVKVPGWIRLRVVLRLSREWAPFHLFFLTERHLPFVLWRVIRKRGGAKFAISQFELER